MSQHDTDVQCPSCKLAKIVAEVEEVPTESLANIPIGPASRNCYRRQVTSFHCPFCQVMFHHPPGRPDAIRATPTASTPTETATTVGDRGAHRDRHRPAPRTPLAGR